MRYDSRVPHLPDPPTEPDPVIEAYKKDVDRTLLRENLKLTPMQRLAKHQAHLRFIARMRGRAPRVAAAEDGSA